MNNFLVHKNEECIKQNSADFYTISIYSKDILEMDRLRLNEFYSFHRIRNEKIIGSSFFKDIYSYKYRMFSGFFIASGLIYTFKSILVVPIFFGGYSIIKKVMTDLIDSFDCKSDCYFCQKNLKKMNQLATYEKFYSMINYVIDNNPNITSMDDFERGLDKSIKENKT